MLSKEQAYAIIDFVVAESAGYDAKVMVQSSATGLTRFANSEIHQNVFEDSTTVGITLTQGRRRSDVRTGLYDEAALRAAVAEAIQNLALLPEGEEQSPLVDAPAEIAADEFSSDLERQYDVVARARLVKECLDLLGPDYKAFGALTYGVTQLVLGNSTGIKRYVRSNNVSFSALVSSDDGGSGYAVASGSAPDKIEILPAFRTAYEKARLNTNPLDIEPGAYTVILEPLAVADLLRYLSFGGFSGKGIQNQTSFLTGRLGSKVFDEKLTMIDDHTHEHTRTLPFDFEGTPRQTITLVENGVAKAVVHDTASARKAGTQSTGHSMNMPAFGGIPLHLVVAPGEKTLKEIIESSDDALLVTRFHYMNPVNPRQAQLTGLTRDGFFKVENGRIVAALKNMRFTESMLQAMNDIAAISSDRQQVGGYYVPAMKIRNFHFTGKASL